MRKLCSTFLLALGFAVLPCAVTLCGARPASKTIAAKRRDVNYRLAQAVRRGAAKRVEVLLNRGADPNFKIDDKDGTYTFSYQAPVLMIAVRKGHIDVCRLLLARGANPNGKDQEGSTPLLKTVNTSLIKLLVSKGANVNARNKQGYTAIFKAAENFNLFSIRGLVSVGADVNQPDKIGTTPLMMISRYALDAEDQARALAGAKILIAKGASINARDRYGYTALMSTTDWNNLGVARLLLDHGAVVDARNKNGETALMRTAWGTETALTQLLLERGANVNAQDADGISTWMRVQRSRVEERDKQAKISLLLRHGADPKPKLTPDQRLLYAASHNDISEAKAALSAGANVNAKDSRGLTALSYAANRVANEYTCDYDALSPAALKLQTAYVKYLLDKGANPNVKGTHDTPVLEPVFISQKVHFGSTY